MKNEFFTTLEKKIEELSDKQLEKWSKQVSEEEFENIETAILTFRYDTLKAIETIIKNK